MDRCQVAKWPLEAANTRQGCKKKKLLQKQTNKQKKRPIEHQVPLPHASTPPEEVSGGALKTVRTR